MKMSLPQGVPIVTLSTALLLSWPAADALAQNSSLFNQTDQYGRRRPLTLAEYSWTYEAPVPKKAIALHDLITVVVDEKSTVVSEGSMDRKKKAHGELVLKDWILLKGLAAYPDPQSKGDPTISGKLDNKLRGEATLDTRASIKFSITCAVVDIRPNGNLMLEGHDTIQYNREVWDYSITGEIRADDIQPNNTVLSEDIANKRITRRETGHVRDGYRRGWLLRILDKWQPF